ncbi:MAG: hypothetical protein ABI823_00355 [Bryobacteraceae bacterium]
MPNRIGLIATGAVSHSFVARLPFVREQLGPVYAPALRVASRVVNGLRVGKPVNNLRDLSACKIVLLVLPDSQLEQSVAEAAECPCNGKVVILCGSVHDSSFLEPLRALGARCASLDVIPGTSERRYVVEGDDFAIAELRRLLGRGNVLVLDRGGKARYQLGLLLATNLTLDVAAEAVESLRGAGLTRPQAVPIVEALMTQMARSYNKAGRRAAPSLPPDEMIARWIATTRRRNPRLAKLLETVLPE